MPSTVNGIGTHYYGRKKPNQRVGTCSHCGRQATLSSYDTRLWFVVVYIPIIPLGRKRIVDQCSACTYHFAVDADKWESSKQLQISGAQERLRADPTPENAIAVHRELMKFHEFDEAASFRQKATGQFPASAQLQADFAEALVHFGRGGEAAAYFERAHSLRPDLPAARIGVAYIRMRTGRLDEARKLLDFLEKPGAAQLYTLEPLEDLGLALQQAGRHEEALALFAKLLEAFPNAANSKGFRAMVQKSENALGMKSTQLPPRRVTWRDRFSWFTRSKLPGTASPARAALILGVVLAVVGLGFAIGNEYIRRHRLLHIVNVRDEQAIVEIVGTGIRRAISRHDVVALPEGKYQAVISGAVDAHVEFEVCSDYFGRWTEHPLWLLNIGGDAVLLRRSVVYSANPPPATFGIHFGRTFEFFPEVTHPFIELPESLQMKSSESRTLVDLQFYDGNGESLLGHFLEANQPQRALDFAETWLRTHPGDESVLFRYVEAARKQKESERAGAYLETELATRPVRIPWHRAYQTLRDTPTQRAALVARYDSLLAAAPHDSALLYLRGRIDADPSVTCDYFERALRADPTNHFAVYGLAYSHLAAGDWAGARPLLERGRSIQPEDSRYEQTLFIARLALGETAAVVRELSEKFTHEPGNVMLAFRLSQALAAQGADRAALLKVCSDFEAANAKQGRGESHPVESILRRYALYLLGDFPALAKASSGKSAPERLAHTQALIEQGLLADAAKSMPPAGDDDDLLVESLVLSAAWSQAGNTAESDRWLEQARQTLAAGDEDSVQAAAWLADAPPQKPAAAESAILPPRLKAAILVAVISRHPELCTELAPLARRLNIDRAFPYHFVQRFTVQSR